MKDTSFRHRPRARRSETWFNDDPIAQPMEIHDWKKWWHPLAVFLIPVLLTLGFIFYVSKYHPPKMFPVKGGHSVRR